MENELMKIDELKALAQKAGALTKAERRALLLTAEQYGLTVKNTNCKQCWSDLAVEVVRMMQQEEREFYESLDKAEQEVHGRKWSVRKGLDVVHLGRRVNADTITDELAEWLLANRFPVYMLVRNEVED